MSLKLWSIRMMLVVGLAGGLLHVSGSAEAAGRPNRNDRNSKKPAAGPNAALNDLSMEVDALLTMHRFQLTAEQRTAFARWAGETMQKPSRRQAARASAEYRRALQELHAALVKGEDDESISELQESLEDAEDANEPDLDDDVEITPAGRRRAVEAFAMITPKQVARFLESQDDLDDVKDNLKRALDGAGKLSDTEWRELTADVVSELSGQLAGADLDRARVVAAKLAIWMRTVRSMSERERAQKRPELEKQISEILDSVPAAERRDNVARRALAELLSNPRLTAAIDARSRR